MLFTTQNNAQDAPGGWQFLNSWVAYRLRFCLLQTVGHSFLSFQLCVQILNFLRTASPRRHFLKPLQRIRILPHQQYQRRCLRIGLGPPLLPLLQRSDIDPQFPRKDRPRTPHSLARLPDELGIHCRKWRRFHPVAPQRQLPFAMFLHLFDAFNQFHKNLSLCHYRTLRYWRIAEQDRFRWLSRFSASASAPSLRVWVSKGGLFF